MPQVGKLLGLWPMAVDPEHKEVNNRIGIYGKST